MVLQQAQATVHGALTLGLYDPADPMVFEISVANRGCCWKPVSGIYMSRMDHSRGPGDFREVCNRPDLSTTVSMKTVPFGL